jgi:flagellar hook-basal body complex protein FliE
MSIDSINFGLKQIAPMSKPKQAPAIEGGAQGGKTSFSEMFGNAIKEVDKLQVEADKQIEGMTTGKEGVTTHGAMIALEKADIAFQLMSTIRSKIIRAYEEVLRTQV